MKIRTGYVSNSSSSSFCIIGVCGQWVGCLAAAENLLFQNMKDYLPDRRPETTKERGCEHPEQDSEFCPQCGAIIWIIEKGEYKWDDYNQFDWGMCTDGEWVNFYGDYEPHYAGIDAIPLLQNMSIPQAEIYFREHIKDNLNVDIPIKAIGFHYGEVGSG